MHIVERDGRQIGVAHDYAHVATHPTMSVVSVSTSTPNLAALVSRRLGVERRATRTTPLAATPQITFHTCSPFLTAARKEASHSKQCLLATGTRGAEESSRTIRSWQHFACE